MGCGSSDSSSAPGAAGSGNAGSSASGGRANAAGGSSANGGASAALGGASSGGSSANAAGGSTPASGGSTAGGAPAASVDCLHAGDGKTTLAFVNACDKALTFAGSDIQGGQLTPGSFKCVDVGSASETISSKRYWGYVGSNPGNEHYTLAEFTFNTDFHDFDWYNISNVDAFNLPLQIVPVGHSDCKTETCALNLLDGCPAEGQFRDASGDVVVCVSPNRDDPKSPVALHFEACDDAYAWSGDDQQGTDPSPMRACAGEDYQIVFCAGAP